MRFRGIALVAVLFAGCGGTNAPAPDEPRAYPFGPFTVQPNQEISDQCVQITLNNDDVMYVNAVELDTGGPGFHHSNWMFVPASNPATGAFVPPQPANRTATSAIPRKRMAPHIMVRWPGQLLNGYTACKESGSEVAADGSGKDFRIVRGRGLVFGL